MPAVPLRAGCKSHRRYQAKRKPRTLCEACWAKWTLKHWQLWLYGGEPRRKLYSYHPQAANALSSDVKVTPKKGFTIYRTLSGGPK